MNQYIGCNLVYTREWEHFADINVLSIYIGLGWKTMRRWKN